MLAYFDRQDQRKKASDAYQASPAADKLVLKDTHGFQFIIYPLNVFWRKASNKCKANAFLFWTCWRRECVMDCVGNVILPNECCYQARVICNQSCLVSFAHAQIFNCLISHYHTLLSQSYPYYLVEFCSECMMKWSNALGKVYMRAHMIFTNLSFFILSTVYYK